MSYSVDDCVYEASMTIVEMHIWQILWWTRVVMSSSLMAETPQAMTMTTTTQTNLSGRVLDDVRR